MGSTIERARGRWQEILPLLGIGTRFLQNRHGTCPLCGGKDRFRFDDLDGSGSYYCNQCGPGPGLFLVRKLHGWDHNTACNEVDKIIGTDDSSVSQSQIKQIDDAEARRRALQRVIAEASAPEIVAGYLQQRGLAVGSDVLLGHPRLWHKEACRCLPAVVAPVLGPDGRLQSVHRIYFGDVEPRKKTMSPVDTITGGAVRLHEPGEDLAVCEGVETGLAIHQMFGLPVWAALTAPGVDSLVLPKELWRVTIFGDNDSNYTGQVAAYKLAHRLSRDGVIVEVKMPPQADMDWLDVLNQPRRRP